MTTNSSYSEQNLATLKSDTDLMFQYAVNHGKELPTNILDNTTLIDNYNALIKIIAPATVKSIRYINSEMLKKGDNAKWYQIPVFTKCVVIALIALLMLIVISLSPTVNEANQSKGLLDSSGFTLLYNLMFICSASLLGVMFYVLKSFGQKIKSYTLLKIDSIELNASILIGVISGFVISELFSFTAAAANMGTDFVEIHKMTLALLGGFSSDAIFSMLQGIVNKFKSLVVSS